jgi:gliding motility-associated lipoprotein GldH
MKRFFLIAVIVLVSCDSNRVFEDNKDFKAKAWEANDTVSFEFTITDDGSLYNLKCNIRNTVDYPFSRIFVNYWLEDSTHHVLANKLVESYLFDMKTGEPRGTSGIGDIYDHQFSLLENRKLGAGKYFVKLQQDMRTDSIGLLPGILAAGIRVEKTEPSTK